MRANMRAPIEKLSRLRAPVTICVALRWKADWLAHSYGRGWLAIDNDKHWILFIPRSNSRESLIRLVVSTVFIGANKFRRIKSIIRRIKSHSLILAIRLHAICTLLVSFVFDFSFLPVSGAAELPRSEEYGESSDRESTGENKIPRSLEKVSDCLFVPRGNPFISESHFSRVRSSRRSHSSFVSVSLFTRWLIRKSWAFYISFSLSTARRMEAIIRSFGVAVSAMHYCLIR